MKEDTEELLRHREIQEKESELANKIKIAEIHAIHFQAQEAKAKLHDQRSKEAQDLIQVNELLQAKAKQEKEEELNRKMLLIQQIKELHSKIQASKLDKQVDLTQTAGYGILTEMSISEVVFPISV
jgi:hypothetical protein